jgi:hypothetical protein
VSASKEPHIPTPWNDIGGAMERAEIAAGSTDYQAYLLWLQWKMPHLWPLMNQNRDALVELYRAWRDSISKATK